MMPNNSFSKEVSVFHGRHVPEEGCIAGYAAIIDTLNLPVPVPERIALISRKHNRYERDRWLVFTPRYLPEDTLYHHIVFALKYEGINLLFFKKLFEQISQDEAEEMIRSEPLGRYRRKIWFLYEWLMRRRLDLPDLKEGNYISLVDEKLQYALQDGVNSGRHRVKNNLPGTVDFCPMVRKTPLLERYIQEKPDEKSRAIIFDVPGDILLRTSAFLLLKDSKDSFTIEGETPLHGRALRWGKAIGQAGKLAISHDELLRLQQIIIEDRRFTRLGYRTAGGFVGEHDRETGAPIPDHISARWQDIEDLMNGLITYTQIVQKGGFHPVLATACAAFGFVFIHPFSDGNGRLHRYLIHHQLAIMEFTPPGFIFPVSAAILAKIGRYREVLEHYSHPLLDFILWRETADHNIEVLNDTADYYRYFDATQQAEFLFECITDTLQTIIPREVEYLKKYDIMKSWLDDRFEMPDKTVALLMRFLEQGQGTLSGRAKSRELSALTGEELREVEKRYKEVFGE